jgi:hypothetical protein
LPVAELTSLAVTSPHEPVVATTVPEPGASAVEDDGGGPVDGPAVGAVVAFGLAECAGLAGVFALPLHAASSRLVAVSVDAASVRGCRRVMTGLQMIDEST